MGRWLGGFGKVATVGLAVVCVLVVALWVRSEFRHDDVGWRRGAGYCHLGSGLGRVMFDRVEPWRQPSTPLVGYSSSRIAPFERGRQVWAGHYWWGFQWFSRPDRPAAFSGGLWVAAVPYWFLLTICAPLPVIGVVRELRRSRPRAGWCAGCGYDLRATPGRCPECGRVVEGDAT